MKYSLPYFLFYFVLLCACSSDPCEAVICSKGACNDGVCDCEEGYIGEKCDQLDLLGSYYYSQIVMDDNCSQQYRDYNPELSDEALCDNLGCSALIYTLNQNNTYTRTYIAYEDNVSGGLVVEFESTSEGTYEVTGNVISLSGGLGNGVVFTFEKNILTYYDTFFQSCKATRYYTKRQI